MGLFWADGAVHWCHGFQVRVSAAVHWCRGFHAWLCWALWWCYQLCLSAVDETGVAFAGVVGAVRETGVAFAGVVGAAHETGVAFAGVNGPVLGGWSRAVVSRVSSASASRRALVLWVSSASASRRAVVSWVSSWAVLLEPSQSVSSAQQYAVWEFKDGMSHAPVRSSSSSVSLLCADGDQNLGDDLVDDAQI